MDRRADPNHSRPLDIHRYCDYPEAKDLVNSLWQTFTSVFQEYFKVSRGRKTSGHVKDQFRALMLDLYVCWLEDSEQYLGIHLGKSAYKLDDRYNQLYISFKIATLAHQCNELGWLDWINFSYAGPDAQGNRTTRIRASDQLIAIFEGCGIHLDQFTYMPNRECILLTNKDPNPEESILRVAGKSLVRYVDTELTTRMRTELLAYNQLLAKTHIDVASLDEPFVSREIRRAVMQGVLISFGSGNIINL